MPVRRSFRLASRPRLVSKPGAVCESRVRGRHARRRRRRRRDWPPARYSAHEVSRTKDFADFTDAEMARAAVLFDELGWRLGVRRTRRWVAARTGPIDLRRVMSRRTRQFGELVDLPAPSACRKAAAHRRPRRRQRIDGAL